MSAATSKPILVLGAYGEAGEAIVRGLHERGLAIIAAGRQREKLERLQAAYRGILITQFDVRDQVALAGAIQGAGLVINCVGPYISSGLQIAQAAALQGCSIIDLASEQEHYRRLQALTAPCRDSGATVLTGAGAYPGLSGLLLSAILAEHPEASSAQLALITGPPAEAGKGGAQMLSGLSELAYEFSLLEEGRLVRARPGRQERFMFPEPFGERRVLLWPQLEILEAASGATVPFLSTFAALSGHALPPEILLRAASWMRPAPGSRSYSLLKTVLPGLQRPPPQDDPTTNHGAIVARVTQGAKTFETALLATDLPTATAWLPVFAAERWVSGSWRPGIVAAPMGFFEAEDVISELRRAEHIAFTRWNEVVEDDRESSHREHTRREEEP